MNKPLVFIAGHNGMVGRAIVKKLRAAGNTRILVAERAALDLTSQAEVNAFFTTHSIEQVYLCAAKVGGILANDSFPADFIYQNLIIEANIIKAAHQNNVDKLMFLGSSCIYPRNAPQPMTESALLNSPLEPTNEPYAIAKIAGIKLCESFNRQYGCDFRSVMPTNLFGAFDNFNIKTGHVIPSLLHRFHIGAYHQQKSIKIWGSGAQKRDFLFVDDMAAACIYLMALPKNTHNAAVLPMQSHINIGSGEECSIRHLAQNIAKITGFDGELIFDESKPDGPKRKLLDVTLLNSLGWAPEVGLHEGLKLAYDWFVANLGKLRN